MAGRPAAAQLAHPIADQGETDGSAPRPLRSDAVKNRERILAAAEATFASDGLGVPIDTVAQRAGVGVGTLYRHFPTKEALFEAIVMTRLESLLDEARNAATADDPGPALFTFLRHFASQASAKHDLFDAMGAAGFDIKSQCAETLDEMKRAVDLLISRAMAAGAVRPGISADEAIGLVVGACQASQHSGYDNATSQRMLDIICDGLRKQ
jgi:AcrR family transcriptional regulator